MFVKNPLQVELAGKIGELSGLQDYSLFLINSGAEANENALKLASFHTGKDRMIAFKGAFHGRTSGAVAVTDNPKYSAPFNSHHNVTFLPLNDIEAVRTELAKGDVAGVIIEGIQGVGGIVIPDDQFMRDLRQVTKEAGVVLILDEIQRGKKADHILAGNAREAIPVIGSYCDIIGVRSFAGLKDKSFDYNETILRQFIEYSGKPVISLESATVHPCQAFADLITINEYKSVARPKVVLTWAPHPRALPQAVPNSFAEWMNAADVDFVITHPEGYELDPQFVGDARVEYDQMKAFEGADFIYAKNWSSVSHYGQILSQDRAWTVGARQMAVTDNAYFMHCLPVRRNMIVTDEVIDSPRSIVIPEAANRVVSAQVVMKRMLEDLQ